MRSLKVQHVGAIQYLSVQLVEKVFIVSLCVVTQRVEPKFCREVATEVRFHLRDSILQRPSLTPQRLVLGGGNERSTKSGEML